MGPREKHTINMALENFRTGTGLRITPQFFNDEFDIAINIDDHELIFNAFLKLFVNRARLGLIANQLKNYGRNPLLITDYVNPTLMTILENNRINFIDAAGNAYINKTPLFIIIKGNTPGDLKKQKPLQIPFYAATLQTIFTLLCNPGLEKAPVREIAEQAVVAHGTAHTTLKELVREGYLLNVGNKLVNKRDLLNRWVIFYAERLKPKYILGRYRIEYDQINNMDLINYDALWGGEAAAAKLTNYLQPFIYTVYIGERQGEFILRNRLKKHPQGNLELVKKFWNFENYEYPDITHPILIYADLLATGDPRNIETAQIIYEKDVVRYIQED